MTNGSLRWEWRTFGEGFPTADRVLGPLAPEQVQDSEERYVVSALSDASVKLRGGVMDVKVLEQVGDDGLELWNPVLKASLPLSAGDAASVLSALGVTDAPLERDEYTVDVFERELVGTNPNLRVVEVQKRRARFLVDGCMVERTELRADGTRTLTIAVESPDPSLVLATVRKLGLDGDRNVSVARGIKTLLELGARRYAVIDVGTNSVKFHLAELAADATRRIIADRAEITRLGEGVDDSGRLAEDAIARTVDAIAAMIDEAHHQGVVAIAAVGTAGLRVAHNRAALVDAVQARCGVTVEVISGEEEGRLAYLAATSALPIADGPIVVFDSGGGSSQFTFGHAGQVDERFSVNVGAVLFTERYGLDATVARGVLDDVLAAVAADLDRLDARPRPDAVIGMGGTTANLAAVKHGLARYDPDVVHGTVLVIAEIDRQIELYRTRDVEGRRQITGLQPKRADIILAGACIVRTILTKLDHDSLTVSDRGLRHGLFVERFAPQVPTRNRR